MELAINNLYEDKLVVINDESITLKDYYFPSSKPKKVLLKDIKLLEVNLPSLATGKWRIQGSGDLRTWFPMDIHRPKRDKIFFMKLKNQWIQIGFTVEDSEKVIKIFQEKGLLHQS